MSDHEDRLIKELRNKDYRETYAEQHVNSAIAAQISMIREQRGFTQSDLAKILGKQQPAISRLENVNNGHTVETLRQVANALDCWLSIRLESWGSLVKDVEDFSMESLRRDRFEDDPLFYGSRATGYVPEPVRWMQRQLLPWLGENGDISQLARWLQGQDLPPVGDLDPPSSWISRAVAVEPANSPFRAKLAERALALLDQALTKDAQSKFPDEVSVGIFSLLADFPMASTWEMLKKIHDDPALRGRVPQAAHSTFLAALIRNQVDNYLKDEWLKTIRDGHHPWLVHANEFDAFEGLKWIPLQPNVSVIVQAFDAMFHAKARRPGPEIDFVDLMGELRERFDANPNFGRSLIYEGYRQHWQSIVQRAWEEVFPELADDVYLPPGESKRMKMVPQAPDGGTESDHVKSSDQTLDEVHPR
jgi:transcriptional regulator with XRE-family HTH domain